MQLQSKAPSSLPGQAELAPAGPEDAQSVPDTNATSIYDLYSPLRRNLIIFTAAFGFLLSFCTSIYLPALKVRSAVRGSCIVGFGQLPMRSAAASTTAPSRKSLSLDMLASVVDTCQLCSPSQL